MYLVTMVTDELHAFDFTYAFIRWEGLKIKEWIGADLTISGDLIHSLDQIYQWDFWYSNQYFSKRLFVWSINFVLHRELSKKSGDNTALFFEIFIHTYLSGTCEEI